MAAQRRFSLHDRGLATGAASVRRERRNYSISFTELPPQTLIEYEHTGYEYTVDILDEDFDELYCDLGRLIQSFNQD